MITFALLLMLIGQDQTKATPSTGGVTISCPTCSPMRKGKEVGCPEKDTRIHELFEAGPGHCTGKPMGCPSGFGRIFGPMDARGDCVDIDGVLWAKFGRR